jgi:acyl-CoA thioester hydrolase
VSEFRFRHAVPVRFADLDVLGHVNHIAFIEILEVGRIAYYFEVLGMRTAREISFVLAELRVRYLAAALLGQTLEVAVRVDWLRRSSSGFSFEIRDPSSGQLCCAGDGVQVFVDLATNQSQPLPERYRERVLAFEGRPLTPP